MSAINETLKNTVEGAEGFEVNQTTMESVATLLIRRKKYAVEFKKTGNEHLLQLIDICNNNIKKLLAL